MTQEAWRELIRSHIATYGHHVTLVSGGPLPRVAYTIGLSPSMGVELVLAGAASLSAADVERTVNEIAARVVASTAHPTPALRSKRWAGFHSLTSTPREPTTDHLRMAGCTGGSARSSPTGERPLGTRMAERPMP